jgi:hypothetical protein
MNTNDNPVIHEQNMLTEKEKSERDERIEHRHQMRLRRLALMDAHRKSRCPTCGWSGHARTQPDTALHMNAAKRSKGLYG